MNKNLLFLLEHEIREFEMSEKKVETEKTIFLVNF